MLAIGLHPPPLVSACSLHSHDAPPPPLSKLLQSLCYIKLNLKPKNPKGAKKSDTMASTFI